MSRDVPAGGDIPAGQSAPIAQSRKDFAARLRGLRLQSGSPSFRHLARITNYSPSTLADATSGRRLPTEAVLKAFVTACGADPAPWVEELRRIAATGRTAQPGSSEADMPSAAAQRHSGRWRVVLLSAGALSVFGLGLGAGRMTAPTTSASEPHPADTAQDLPGVPPFSGTPAAQQTSAPVPRPAAPSPSCSGYPCSGHDPYHYNCRGYRNRYAGAYSGGIKLAVLVNAYGHCNANWSVGYLTAAGLAAHDTIVIDIHTTDSHRNYEFMCEPNIYGSGNTGNLIEPCIGGSTTTCARASTRSYGGGSPAWTDMLDGTKLTYSGLCVLHGTTLVATASTQQ